MNTKVNKSLIFPFVLVLILIVAACSKEQMSREEFRNTQSGPELNAYPHAAVNPSVQNRILAEIRRGTAKYHDVEVALADGYLPPPGNHCVANETGAMGLHFVKPELIFANEIVYSQPQVLLYEFIDDVYTLVGVEFLVNYDLWNDEYGIENPPVLGSMDFDVVLDAPPPPDGPGRSYQLHVWVWRNNPLGMYEPYNPNVSCAPMDME